MPTLPHGDLLLVLCLPLFPNRAFLFEISTYCSHSKLIWNLGCDNFREKRERFLTAKIASLWRNDIGHTFLHDVHRSRSSLAFTLLRGGQWE